MTDELTHRRRHNQMLIDRVQGVPAVETGAASENDPNAPAPTGDSAGLAAYLDPEYASDTSPEHMARLLKGRDDFIVSRGLWSEFAATLDRQPPQPTGDVGELVKRLRSLYENWSLGSKGHDILLEAADALSLSDSRSMLPAKDVCVDREVLNHTLEAGKREIATLQKALRTAREALKTIANRMLRDMPRTPENEELDDERLMFKFMRETSQIARAALTGAGEEGE